MSSEGIECEDMGLIQLVQKVAQSRGFVYVKTKFPVSHELGNISAVLVIISLSGIHVGNLVIWAYNKNNKSLVAKSV
jgi:hypothetical protein